MQCQAQARGKTIKQEFIITVIRKLFHHIISEKSISSFRLNCSGYFNDFF